MSTIINPWASYDPDDIPDLNPHCKEDLYDLIFGGCGAFIAFVVYVIIMCLLITYDLNMYLRSGLILGVSLIYAVLTIVLMKLGFKISDKIISKKRKQTKKQI